MRGALRGPAFADEDIARWLDAKGLPAARFARDELAAPVLRGVVDDEAGEQESVDGLDDRREIATLELGCARAARKQGVARKDER